MFKKKTKEGNADRILEITNRLQAIEKELADEKNRISAAANSPNDADMARLSISTLYEGMGLKSPYSTPGMTHYNELKAEKEKLEDELAQLQ